MAKKEKEKKAKAAAPQAQRETVAAPPAKDIQNQAAAKAAPEVLGSAPEVLGSAPEVLGSAPEVLGSAPEVLGSAPEVLGSAPGVLGSAPGVLGSAPEAEAAPEVVKFAPKAKSAPEKAESKPAEVASTSTIQVPEQPQKLKKKEYEAELARLQIELVKLQEWIKYKGLKVVVIFEGRDAAGKGGTIKRITESLNPRVCRVVALGTPTEREKTQWYFQRYVPHLPAAGEMVLFDRSWYNRAGVERVMGFCTDAEYIEFLRSCPEFERMLVRAGIILVKYWFSVSDQEQERRFQARINDRTKRWKLSPMDLQSRERWVEYSKAKDAMFASTDIKQAPWYVVNSDSKPRARLNCINHLLSTIPYEDLTPEPLVLPPRQAESGYIRPPMTDQSFVPEVY